MESDYIRTKIVPLTDDHLELLRRFKAEQDRDQLPFCLTLRQAKGILQGAGFPVAPGGHFITQLLNAGCFIVSGRDSNMWSKEISFIPKQKD